MLQTRTARAYFVASLLAVAAGITAAWFTRDQLENYPPHRIFITVATGGPAPADAASAGALIKLHADNRASCPWDFDWGYDPLRHGSYRDGYDPHGGPNDTATYRDVVLCNIARLDPPSFDKAQQQLRPQVDLLYFGFYVALAGWAAICAGAANLPILLFALARLALRWIRSAPS